MIRSVITSVTFQPNPGWRVTTVLTCITSFRHLSITGNAFIVCYIMTENVFCYIYNIFETKFIWKLINWTKIKTLLIKIPRKSLSKSISQSSSPLDNVVHDGCKWNMLKLSLCNGWRNLYKIKMFLKEINHYLHIIISFLCHSNLL